MLLADQVELLRECMPELRQQRLTLPLMGGVSATRQTYRFKSLLHPARDIATTISQSDPAGNQLPTHLRSWNLDIEDAWGRPKTIHLKKLLGMAIHVYYLHLQDNRLDVSNDLGHRVIVPYDYFLGFVERLVLSPQDICQVICGLAEQKLESTQTLRELMWDVPGSGDLLHCLATVGKWPNLKETIWRSFFAEHTSLVGPDCSTINDVPFIMGGQQMGRSVLWHIGWRRNDSYATSQIDVACLIREIRDYFSNSAS